MALGSNLAGVARVAFEAQTAQFYAELEAAEVRFKATLARMEASARRSNVNLSSAAPAAMGGRVAQPAPQRPLSTTPGAVAARERRAATRTSLGSTTSGAPVSGQIDKATASTERLAQAERKAAAGGVLMGRGTKAAEQGVVGMTTSLLKSSAAFAGIYLGIEALRELTHHLMESQRVAAQTEAVIESTGGVAGVTADHVEELGLAMQKKTLFDDEQIRSSENMLLTFTRIRNVAGENNDVFDQATVAVADMGQAFNKAHGSTDGLQRMSILLGKALNDPIKGATALRRVGILLTTEQREQIKTLVEHGKTLEAQKIILGEVSREFGGSAVAATKTFGGQLTVLKHQVMESAETFGNQITPALSLFVKVLFLLVRVLTPLKPLIVAVTIAWLAMKLQIIQSAVALAAWIVQVAIVTAFMIAQVGVIGTLTIAWAALDAAMAANPIGAVVIALVLLGTALYVAWQKSETFRKIVEMVFHAVAGIVARYIQIVVRWIGLYLLGLQKIAEAASHLPLIGDKFKGVAEAIGGVRDKLISLSDDLYAFTQKDWQAKVEVTFDAKSTPAMSAAFESGMTPFTTDPIAAAVRGATTKPGGEGGAKRPPGETPPDKTKTSGSVADLPGRFALAESQAKTDAEFLAAYRASRAWLQNKLSQAKKLGLTKAEMAELQTAINQQSDNIKGVYAAQNQANEQARRDAKTQHDKEVEAAKSAREKFLATPERISAGEVAAEGTVHNFKDDLKWALRDKAFLLKRLALKNLTYEERKDLQGRLNTVQGKIDQLHDDKKARQAAAKQRAMEREDLILERAMARAELTPGTADEQAVLRRQERLVLRRLKVLENKKKLTNEQLQQETALYGQLKSIRDKRLEAATKEADDQLATAQLLNAEFARMMTEFTGDVMTGMPGGGFGTNVATSAEGAAMVGGGQTVVVNQHFNAPTPDRMREARLAAIGAKAAFDG